MNYISRRKAKNATRWAAIQTAGWSLLIAVLTFCLTVLYFLTLGVVWIASKWWTFVQGTRTWDVVSIAAVVIVAAVVVIAISIAVEMRLKTDES